jgi:hypothetical protein
VGECSEASEDEECGFHGEREWFRVQRVLLQSTRMSCDEVLAKFA